MEQNKDTRYEVIKQSKSQDLLEEVLHTDASASTLADFLINENHVNDNSSKEKDFDKEITIWYQRLIDRVSSYITDRNALKKIEEAYKLAKKAHAGQVRASNEPYIIHPISVAYILAGLQMDLSGIIAAILHDVVEDTEYAGFPKKYRKIFWKRNSFFG